MTETVETAVKATKVAAEIIRGRMPVAVVNQIRFGNNKGEAVGALAALYGTTVGKISDIQKNRNFAYVTADFRPTAAMKAEGVAWLQKHPKFSTGDVDKLIVELESTGEASAEESAAFDAARVAARGQSTTTKTGEPAAAGGGNRRKAKKGAATEAAAETSATAADAASLLG